MAAVHLPGVDKVFNTIAEEVGVSRDELTGDVEFAELGVDGLLAKCILSKLNLPATTFNTYPTAGTLEAYLNETRRTEATTTTFSTLAAPYTGSGPLSLVLQGQIANCKRVLFLLPDGSGSGMAYAMIPRIDPDICLIALNSPFLRAPSTQRFSVEGIAAIWAEEIQRRQPKGPYYLGGWSAGGYYSFEVAKILLAKGHIVEKLVLIDSPCRLVYEELPMEVVHYLSTNEMMGNWGTKKPPAWMINHFDMSIKAISQYVPTPIRGSNLPEVMVIWAQEGVLKDANSHDTFLNFSVKVTRMLLERPTTDGALGWDKLFPGAKMSYAKMPGNHFTIVYPPNVTSLALLLKDSVQGRASDLRGRWRLV